MRVMQQLHIAINSRIGQRLKQARQKRRETLLTAGKIIGVSPQQVARLEAGAHRIGAAQALLLANFFQVHPHWLYDHEELSVPHAGAQHVAGVREARTVDDHFYHGAAADALTAAFRIISPPAVKQSLLRLAETLAYEGF